MKNDPIENHIKEVSRILRDFKQPNKWKDSPWLSSCLVKDYVISGKSQTPYQAVRSVFSDVLVLLSQESPYYEDILRGRFWEGLFVRQMVKNGRPQYWEQRNFYIYQNKAIMRFTTLLLEREQICQKAVLQNKLKYTGIFLKSRIAIIGALLFSFIAVVSLLIVFRGESYLISKPYSGPTLVSPNTLLAPTSMNGEVIFQENFDNGSENGFKNKLGLWTVVSDANGNKVLDINSMDTSIEYPVIEFGESSWKDFIFESRINIVDYSTSNDAPLASIRFRGSYKVAFTPYWKSFELVFDPPWKSIAGRTIEIQKNTWYLVRIEAKGSKINVFLENKLAIPDVVLREISGLFGFGTWPGAHVQFDDVVIALIDK